MKYIITVLSVFVLASAAHAGCGKKVATVGEVSAVDSEKKAVTITVAESSDTKQLDAKKTTLTMTADTKVLPADASLEGKKVSVVSEHGKIDYVIVLASQ